MNGKRYIFEVFSSTALQRSGVDAFRDLSGQQLDGDGNRAPGGDYVGEFEIGLESVVVGLPALGGVALGRREAGEGVSFAAGSLGLTRMLDNLLPARQVGAERAMRLSGDDALRSRIDVAGVGER